jgi:hypothetical protein
MAKIEVDGVDNTSHTQHHWIGIPEVATTSSRAVDR